MGRHLVAHPALLEEAVAWVVPPREALRTKPAPAPSTYVARIRHALDVARLEVVTSAGDPLWAADEPVDDALWLDRSRLAYTVVDATGRAHAVRLRDFDGAAERTIFERRGDTRHFLSITRTSDPQYLRIVEARRLGSRPHLLRIADEVVIELEHPPGAWTTEVDVGPSGVVIASSNPRETAWHIGTLDRKGRILPLVPLATSVTRYRWFRTFSRWLVVVVPDTTGDRVVIHDLVDHHEVQEDLGNASWASDAYEDQGWIQLVVSDLAGPDQVMSWHPDAGFVGPEPEGREPYATRVIPVPASDGSTLPVSLLWDGRDALRARPMLLLSYGCYGHSFGRTYAEARRSLLDRGVLIGIAHVRGGGELGHSWHWAGANHLKGRSAEDLIDAVDFLTREGIVDPDRVVLRSQSAGAAVVVSALHRRPDLAAGVVLDAPHLDVADLSGQGCFLTEFDLPEWGVLERGGQSSSGWSPFECTPRGPLPPMLLLPRTRDGRVPSGECERYLEAVSSTGLLREATIRPVDGQHQFIELSEPTQAELLAEVFGWILARLRVQP